MGTWNTNERNLNTKYAFYFLEDENNEIGSHNVDEVIEHQFNYFFEGIEKNRATENHVYSSQRKDGQEYILIEGETNNFYYQFEIPIGYQIGYYHSTFYKLGEITCSIWNKENECNDFHIENVNSIDFMNGLEISEKKARKIYAHIANCFRLVEYEVNRLLHYKAKKGLKMGWCTSEYSFKNVYPEPYEYKMFDFQEVN